MRYHSQPPAKAPPEFWTKTYICDHPVYSSCTLFYLGKRGLAVIQQRFDSEAKHTWWGPIDSWLANAIYVRDGFKSYFEEHSGEALDGLYPTVPVRKVTYALRMKPMKVERWETYFTRSEV